jgi:hypothetical protein
MNLFGMSKINLTMRSRKKSLIFTVLIIPFYFLSLFSNGTSDVDYFAAWAREFVHGNFYELFQLNPSRQFEYSVGQSTTSAYPYPPIGVMLMGIFALVITQFFGESLSTYIFSVNLLSLVALISICLIIYKDKSLTDGATRNKAISFLLNPFVLLLFVLLGYQDAVSGFLVLLAMKQMQIKRYLMAGLFLSLAIFTKQLALLVLLPTVFLIIFVGVKSFLRFMSGLFLGSALSLLPFMFTHNISDFYSKLVQGSMHNILSANAYNFPWFINILRSLFFGNIDFGVQTQGIPLDSFTIWKGISTYNFFSAFYLLFLLFLMIALIRYRKNSIENLPIVSVICVLGYYLFAPGVHENHFLFVLPLVIWAVVPKEIWIFHLLVGIVGINCFLRYGIGRNWSDAFGFHQPSFEILNYFGLLALFCTLFIFLYLIYKLFYTSNFNMVKTKKNR